MRISPDKTSCQGRHARIAINGVRNKESDIQLLVESLQDILLAWRE